MRCKDCKYFKRLFEETEKHYGECQSDKFIYGDNGDDKEKTDKLYYSDYEWYKEKTNGENFGCIHWEGK